MSSHDAITGLLFDAREYSTAAVMLHYEVAERFDLSVSDLKTLDVLQRTGPLSAGDIAAHTGLTTASVTSLIDRLEKRGFVRRSADPGGDRRRVVVKLTPKVEKTIAPLFESLNRRMLRRFAQYNESQIEAIRDFLRQAAEEMRDEASKLGRDG